MWPLCVIPSASRPPPPWWRPVPPGSSNRGGNPRTASNPSSSCGAFCSGNPQKSERSYIPLYPGFTLFFFGSLSRETDTHTHITHGQKERHPVLGLHPPHRVGVATQRSACGATLHARTEPQPTLRTRSTTDPFHPQATDPDPPAPCTLPNLQGQSPGAGKTERDTHTSFYSHTG